MEKKLKFLVTGCSGLLGSKIFKLFSEVGNEVLGTYNSEFVRGNCVRMDITNKEEVEKIIELFKPDIIIHTAALTNVDYCEDHKEEATKVNVMGTKNVVESAKRIGSKVVYISTDYVFDGRSGPYSEEDQPNPLGFYAKTKLEGEAITLNLNPSNLVVRTTVVYGQEKNKLNFALWLIKKLKSKEKIKVVSDQYGSPTFADDAAEIILKLIKNEKAEIYNVAGPEVINRYEFALKIANCFNLEKTLISPVSTKELNQKVQRPLFLGLKLDKILKLGLKPMSIEDSLKNLRNQIET